MYSHHKEQKKRANNAWILEELKRGVFTPQFFSTSGGMEEDAKTLFKRVAAKMANKTEVLGDNHLHQKETALRPSEYNGHRTAGLQGQAVAIKLH